jgi:hypothetical protein
MVSSNWLQARSRNNWRAGFKGILSGSRTCWRHPNRSLHPKLKEQRASDVFFEKSRKKKCNYRLVSELQDCSFLIIISQRMLNNRK